MKSGKLRVANIIEEGRLGGPQVRMVRVASAMKEVNTLIFMPTYDSFQFQELCQEKGIPYLTLPMSRVTYDWRAVVKYLAFFFAEISCLAHLLKKHKIDLVHASGGSWQWKAVIAAKQAGIPSVWHLNDTSVPIVVRFGFSFLSKLADGFIFASERSREYYGNWIGISNRPQAVIPSTVDVRFFDPGLRYSIEGKMSEKLKDSLVIGTVANINPTKDLETLIRAAAKVRSRHSSLKVLIVGSAYRNQNHYKRKLVGLAKDLGIIDIIEWVGAQSDVRPYLSLMDIYVCSSLTESSPVSVWEAMAMARPVVSTDVGDVSLYVKDGKGGFIVKVGDYNSMANRINYLLDRPAVRQEMGRYARYVSENNFTPEVISKKTEELYKEVVQRSSS